MLSPFTDCSVGVDQLGISGVDVAPRPVGPGEAVTVKFSGTAADAITAGDATLTLRAIGTVIATEDYDLCADMGIDCPLAAGDSFTGSFEYQVTDDVSQSITVSAEIIFADTAGDELACISADIASYAADRSPNHVSPPFDGTSIAYIIVPPTGWRVSGARAGIVEFGHARRCRLMLI